jgi:hypothetical protein
MKKTETIDLFTPTDIKKARDTLFKEQDGKCLILGTLPKDRTTVLDHAHDEEQFVRGVIEREVNALLGVIENAHKRHLRYWLPTPLPDVLRACAGYLERPVDTRYRHSGWQKKLQTKFNVLTSVNQNEVLSLLGQPTGKNPAERKKFFKKALSNRNLGYNAIKQAIVTIKQTKE